jgi:hypothetical protein
LTGTTPAIDAAKEAPPVLNPVLTPHIDSETISAMQEITELGEREQPKSRGTKRYEKRRDGYKQLLKDIQESKLHVFKIRGGNTSIFDEEVVKEVIMSPKVVAPVVKDEDFRGRIRNVITVSPAECRF